MLSHFDGPTKFVLSIVLFPLFFQNLFLNFAWGAADPMYLTILKRLFILLPTGALILGLWLSIGAVLSMVFRSQRRQFATALMVTWWDLGRSIFSYWGGIFKFSWLLIMSVFGFTRLCILMLVVTIKDLVLAPLRLLQEAASGYSNPGIPWISVGMMAGWTLLEALIFTYVMTPLVQDVLSGIVGGDLEGPLLQIPMYLMFVVFVLGSYAVLHAFGEALKSRETGKIVNFVIVEAVVAAVEIVFLYREFVDALLPWFAQHAGDDFQLGIIGTLSISFGAWLGIRAMTWFLFGKTGVPTLMAIIERKPLRSAGKAPNIFNKKEKAKDGVVFVYMRTALDQIQQDSNWFKSTAEELFSSMVLPPLQIVAAVINFFTILTSSSHMFEVPFRTYKDLIESRSLMVNAKKSLLDRS